MLRVQLDAPSCSGLGQHKGPQGPFPSLPAAQGKEGQQGCGIIEADAWSSPSLHLASVGLMRLGLRGSLCPEADGDGGQLSPSKNSPAPGMTPPSAQGAACCTHCRLRGGNSKTTPTWQHSSFRTHRGTTVLGCIRCRSTQDMEDLFSSKLEMPISTTAVAAAPCSRVLEQRWQDRSCTEEGPARPPAQQQHSGARCFVFFNKVCNPMDTQNKTALRKTVP